MARFSFPIAALFGIVLSWMAPCVAPTVAQETAGKTAAGTAGEDAALDPAAAGLHDELRALVAHARDRVFPALLSIQVVTVDFEAGKERKGRVTGSGTLISDDGLVVTNEHVTRSGQRFVCILSDQRRLPATLVGADPLTDLALLRIDPEAVDAPLPPPAELGVSASLEIGDVVLAMGSPFSLARSVSLGIVSNTERVFAGGFGSDDIEGLRIGGDARTGLFTRWIQHDAVIAPGNSGGPLVDLDGRVIGVNELGGGALSFAIPSDLARRVIADLRDDGKIERSWFGLTLRSIEDSPHETGARVGAVIAGGPAAKAGIEAGDILLSIDGEPVNARFAEEVPPILERLAGLPIGEAVVLEVGRAGERHQIDVTTARFEGRAGDERAFPAWGFTARTITPEWARNRGQEGLDGVRITGVRQGGAAQQAEPSFQRRDMLRELAGRSIESVADLVTLYAERTAPGIGPEPFVATLERDGHELLTVLDPRREPGEDPPRELPKAWIGVASQPLLTELAEQLGWGELRGFRITRVYPGTEAERAGLQVGDIIRAVGGESLVPAGKQDVAMLSRRVRGLRIGETVQLDVLRDGVATSVPVVLERTRLAPEEARRHEDPDFEWTVRELTFFDRDIRRLDADTDGVLVQTVERAGWADLGGLRPGDLITEIDGRSIRGLRSFRDAVDVVRSARPATVPIRVLRGLRIHYREIEPDWGPTTADGGAVADDHDSTTAGSSRSEPGA